ncbi:hypothetical protein [Lysinibacillus fusiformis]|uniref:hypothetical protein n=1 Tax=Lysinibacillus fusiformis TaxID=28031 RepID=UPI001782654E|nr:hypothetical protein [Lysinibacillus fusiformis]
MNGSSKDFNLIIHLLLENVGDFFMEIVSNLDYKELYADVFPLHLQSDKEYGMALLKKLQGDLRDNFVHSPPKYILEVSIIDNHSISTPIVAV